MDKADLLHHDGAEPDTDDPRESAADLAGRAYLLLSGSVKLDDPADELPEIIYCLTMAAVKVKKLPGGKEAAELIKNNTERELARRKAARDG